MNLPTRIRSPRLLATIATLLMAGFSISHTWEIRIDWKNTYRLNAVLDGISTWQFRQSGAIELNPIAAPFVNNDRWVEAGLLLVGEMVFVDWIESRLPRKCKGLAYFLGAVAHGYCTWSNRSHGATMIPIPVLQVRF